MKSFNLTGHYIVDAALAASAALLEYYDQRIISKPQEMGGADIIRALELAEQYFYYRQISKENSGDQKPLFYYLLQEILPGSSWDNTRPKKGTPAYAILPATLQSKFTNYVSEIKAAIASNPLGVCYLTGKDGHLLAGKMQLPMVGSSLERPNAFPNLEDGLLINGYVALLVLLSPLGIEKTVNSKGDGSENLVYHATDWRFMVSIAEQNIDRIRRLLAAGSLESFRSGYYPSFRRGTWRKGLQTLMHATQSISADARPQVVIWSFNASNQSCRYECRETSDAFLTIAAQRRLQPALYKELLSVSDDVAQLILQSVSIISASFIRDKAHIDIRPGWPFQRFYAEKVLFMSSTKLNLIEEAAQFLNKDQAAINYCLYEASRPDVRVLADRYKLTPETVARLASMPGQWPDYLRAALIWVGKGNEFGQRLQSEVKPEEIELVFQDVSPRLANIGSHKLAARLLNTPNPRTYRQAWIRLLSRKAATWNDFLFFNPIEEAFGSGDYGRTSTLRHYLVAYLLANAHQQTKTEDLEMDEAEIEDEMQQLEQEMPFAEENEEEI